MNRLTTRSQSRLRSSIRWGILSRSVVISSRLRQPSQRLSLQGHTCQRSSRHSLLRRQLTSSQQPWQAVLPLLRISRAKNRCRLRTPGVGNARLNRNQHDLRSFSPDTAIKNRWSLRFICRCEKCSQQSSRASYAWPSSRFNAASSSSMSDEAVEVESVPEATSADSSSAVPACCRRLASAILASSARNVVARC